MTPCSPSSPPATGGTSRITCQLDQEKRGKALRALVLPALRAQADAAGVAIYTTAASEKLAKDYAAELPGLVDVGAGRLRGRRMRREPGAATADWSSTAP